MTLSAFYFQNKSYYLEKYNIMMNQFTKIIAAQLKLREQAVENTLELLEEGCTIPFISRYRKEKTGNMDEVNIEAIAQANDKLKEMAKRKETILKTIDEQGKLTDALKKRIEECWDATELEDIYLPFKPKRRTRAQIAREAGLEPLAQTLLFQRERNIMQVAKKYVGDKVADADAASASCAGCRAAISLGRHQSDSYQCRGHRQEDGRRIRQRGTNPHCHPQR